MYDLAVFLGFAAFVLSPCVVSMLSRSKREEEATPALALRVQSSRQTVHVLPRSAALRQAALVSE